MCSPTRSLVIASQLSPAFSPSLVYEPIPDRCVPAELPALREVLPRVDVFSPNHERVFALGAADVVLIRSGPLGAYAVRRGRESEGVWVPAYHSYEDGRATGKVVDVTGAGNSFLVRRSLSQSCLRVRSSNADTVLMSTTCRAGSWRDSCGIRTTSSRRSSALPSLCVPLPLSQALS